ncbi:family 78 glycoside hydrolase catalytic domain [Cohnella silvisoli]|uniref:alpha-L-rhamnosidase n=1 Tax=Cohnella silvisoli TaxID=2873699 RepID=A0ABV1KT25_9BACL|nr:family 78 glycoside hydrolase catalytic domain [Cohnella silvisoli]MCD9021450.1 glycoside hydrolase family 78 protein [Cohnella silvisoli]
MPQQGLNGGRKATFILQNLRCEYLKNPLGIDYRNPRLSWNLQSDEPGKRQSAYRIMVSSSYQALQAQHYELWDSGKVPSDQSVHLQYEGKELASGQRCYWKVQVWDELGCMEESTDSAWWETGLLEVSDWQGDWIGTGERHLPGWSPLFRKEFSAQSAIITARAYVCGLGYYELYLNGHKVGDHVLDPSQTDYEERVMYVTYDVTEMLLPGNNAVGIMLGDGWYHQHRVWYGWMIYGIPSLIFQMELEYTDGSRARIVSDESWMTTFGPVTLNSVYAGEVYDTRLEKPGWSEPKYIASDWLQAEKAPAPGGKLVSQHMPAVKRMEFIQPIGISQPKDGVYVVDMGRNLSGWIRLQMEGLAGCEVTLRYAETVDQLGMIDTNSGAIDVIYSIQTDRYILKGKRVEIWEPRFTYHGFRFVEITGFPGIPTVETLEGIVLYNAVKETGAFECSNEMINRLHRMIKNTITSNLQGVITDCPVREKCGWLGDAMVIAEATMYNWDSVTFWKKFIEDIKTTRKVQGQWMNIAPGKRTCGEAAPAWGLAQLEIPWILYQFCGDKELLKEHYDAMKQWVDHLLGKSENYIVSFGTDDWCPPDGFEMKGKTVPQISTACFYLSAMRMAEIASVLSRHEDAQAFEKLALAIKGTFNAKFYSEINSTYGTQALDSIALTFGLVPSCSEQAVADALAVDIRQRELHLTTGHLGLKHVFNALCDYGYAELAIDVLEQTTYPSFGHQMLNGATTLWEYWEGDADLPGMSKMGSLSHPFKGGFDAWMYSHILGIRSGSPGFQKIIIQPTCTGALTFARGFYRSIHGVIVSDWSIRDGLLTLHVEIPANTTALVFVPVPKRTEQPSTETKSDLPRLVTKHPANVEFVRWEKEYAVYHVSSGIYDFIA